MLTFGFVAVTGVGGGGVGASSLLPSTLPLRGVCGGVVSGTPATDEATPGIVPRVGVGLFIGAGTDDVTEEVDEDRAGELGGRARYGAGDNGARLLGAILLEGVEVGFKGAEAEVGVGVAERLGTGPEYLSPSSPGANITTEQNPSVDVMSSVKPSDDLGNQVSIGNFFFFKKK